MSPELARLQQFIVNAKVDVMRYAIPGIVVSADGQLVETYYDPQATAHLAELDVIWAQAVEEERRRGYL